MLSHSFNTVRCDGRAAVKPQWWPWMAFWELQTNHGALDDRGALKFKELQGLTAL
jgi:hypothetical protein